MDVQTIRSTPDPEQLVCIAARGDYFDGFVADVSYGTLMDGVSVKDRHRDGAAQCLDRTPSELDCKQYALLEKTLRRGHYGVWEHPQITLGIKGVSRACMAQLTRHRHATYDVQSQRYVDFSEKDDPFAMPESLTDPEHATRDEGAVDISNRESWLAHVKIESGAMFDQYEQMVDDGVPKEDARFMLPIGTKVNMTVSMSGRTLLHIANLRMRGNAQWEIRELTEQIVDDEFADWMPMTAHIWDEHGPTDIAP